MYPIIVLLATSPAPFGSPTVHLGERKAGPVVAAKVPLTFAGPGRVTITGVEGSCGCVRATTDRTDLAAGETANLNVELNTLTQAAGPNAWRITVRSRSDAAGDATTEVRLTATITREIELTPPAVSISTVDAAGKIVTLTDRRPRPLTVTSTTSSSPVVTVEIAAIRKNETLIRLSVSEKAPVGHHSATVALTTDDPEYRELRLPVSVSKRAAGGVAVSPEAVSLRFADGQAEASAVVLVRSLSGTPVRVESAECDHPAVRLKWAAVAGPTTTVRVGVAGGGTGKAVVHVRLAEPAGHRVEVPVSWGE